MLARATLPDDSAFNDPVDVSRVDDLLVVTADEQCLLV
jgi:hypothetical protein